MEYLQALQHVQIFTSGSFLSNEVACLPPTKKTNKKQTNGQTHTDLSPLTSHSLAETSRKALKSKNDHGSPIRLQSKILAIISHPADSGAIYVAESAGTARRVVLEVGEIIFAIIDKIYPAELLNS